MGSIKKASIHSSTFPFFQATSLILLVGSFGSYVSFFSFWIYRSHNAKCGTSGILSFLIICFRGSPFPCPWSIIGKVAVNVQLHIKDLVFEELTLPECYHDCQVLKGSGRCSFPLSWTLPCWRPPCVPTWSQPWCETSWDANGSQVSELGFSFILIVFFFFFFCFHTYSLLHFYFFFFQHVHAYVSDL